MSKWAGPAMLLCGVLTGLAGVAAAQVPQRAFEGRDLFSMRWVSDPQIRGDGDWVAIVVHANDSMTDREVQTIAVADVSTGREKPVGTQPGSYSSPRWSPDGDHLAYLYSPAGATNSQIFVYSVRSGESSVVTNVDQSPRDIAWSPDGGSIAFVMRVAEPALTLGAPLDKPAGAKWAEPLLVIKDVNYRADGRGYLKRGYTHLFVVPASGGTPRQVTTGTYNEVGPLSWMPDGKEILLTTNRDADWERQPMHPSGSHPRHMNVYRVSVADGSLTALNADRVGSFRSPLASPDGRRLAYLGFDDKAIGYQDAELTIADRDGKNARSLLGKFDRPINTCAWAGDGQSLVCSYEDLGVTHLAQVTLAGRVTPIAQDLTEGASSLDLPDTGGEFSLSRNGVVAFTGGGALQPPELFVVRRGKTAQLGHHNDELLAQVRFGSLQSLAVKSTFDQRTIGAWELRPPNFDSHKKYPLILEIHGGPHGSYGPVFSVEHQRFAAAGYVVVYGNPRGSTSYGEEFANLIHHDYPGHDFDDLMSIVDAAIENGSADPDNLFVTGQSGGGVLTSWSVGNTHRFRAAVAQSPVVDWTSWVLTSDVYAYTARSWFEKLPWDDPGAYWRRSPISKIGNVTTPTLMIVGDQDLRTTRGQAEEFYQALQLVNVPTSLIIIPGASHTIFRPSQFIAQTNAITAWFERYKQAKP